VTACMQAGSACDSPAGQHASPVCLVDTASTTSRMYVQVKYKLRHNKAATSPHIEVMQHSSSNKAKRSDAKVHALKEWWLSERHLPIRRHHQHFLIVILPVEGNCSRQQLSRRISLWATSVSISRFTYGDSYSIMC